MLLKSTFFGAAFTLVSALAIQPAFADDDGPTDTQIAHIAYTAGNIDMRYAHLALAKSDNPTVREFAELMLRDHEAVNDKALALLNKLGAAPEDNPTSQQLNTNAKAKRDEMAALSGKAFDRAYADNELAYHQFVNETVENAFIPAADNKEFKALLGVALEVFQAHEGHAEMMVKSLK